jgi:hypothetical protein
MGEVPENPDRKAIKIADSEAYLVSKGMPHWV